jgi:predicted HTH transcriptional regulator
MKAMEYQIINNDAEALKDFLNEQLATQESYEVEFKHAHGGFPRSFWETYSSFANTDGGVIIFGVKEKDNLLSIDPIDEDKTQEILKTFWKQVRSRESISCCLLTNKDVKVVEYDGSHVIFFYIPRAQREERPVYVGLDPNKGTYRRGHEGDFICTTSEVHQFYADSNLEFSTDSRIMEGFSLSDLDSSSLKQYRQRFAIAFPDHVWLGLEDKELLSKLGGYRIDRKTGQEGITAAGLLMFGKMDAINDAHAFPYYMVDYREYTESSERWSNRIWSDGTWESNLFQFFTTVLPRLQSVLPKPFRLEGNTRIEQTAIHKSVREAFVNCCIHAAYNSNVGITIIRKPTEIIFTNPGTMLVSQRQFYSGGVTVCRNPYLQRMFAMIGGGDKAGSGGDVIIKGWRESNWRTPYLVERTRPDLVDLYLPLESVLADSVKEILCDLFGPNVFQLDHNSLLILAMAVQTDVTNEMLQYYVDVHRADITKLLRSLCRVGYLEAVGVGRATKYHLLRGKKSLQNELVFAEQEHIEDNDTKVQEANLPDNEPINFCTKVDTKARTKARTKAKLLNSTDTEEINFCTKADTKVHTKTTIDKTALLKEVQFYCSVWRKTSDIAQHLGMNPAYVSGYIIKEMLDEGLLIREYPDSPKHPGQRYRNKPKNN